MLPIGPMMIEHRLIERMIRITSKKIIEFKEGNQLDPLYINEVVDFIRIYADKTHHGKEEDILFRELKKKELGQSDAAMMRELLEDHAFARRTTKKLADCTQKYKEGDSTLIPEILALLTTIIEFYPKHIEKEDKHFFLPVMKYFSLEEQENMLEEGFDYDHRMIHQKYKQEVEIFEKELGIQDNSMNKNWLERI